MGLLLVGYFVIWGIVLFVLMPREDSYDCWGLVPRILFWPPFWDCCIPMHPLSWLCWEAASPSRNDHDMSIFYLSMNFPKQWALK